MRSLVRILPPAAMAGGRRAGVRPACGVRARLAEIAPANAVSS